MGWSEGVVLIISVIISNYVIYNDMHGFVVSFLATIIGRNICQHKCFLISNGC